MQGNIIIIGNSLYLGLLYKWVQLYIGFRRVRHTFGAEVKNFCIATLNPRQATLVFVTIALLALSLRRPTYASLRDVPH